MEIPKILKRLDHCSGTVPIEALEAAVARKDEITPELLRIVENAVRDARQLAQQPERSAHIYALYLLAQFRERRAYPLIVRLFSLPDELPFEVAADVITEDLDRILASVSGGDLSGMAELVGNERVNEYVRAAALRAMVVLVACGEIMREEVIDYFAELFRTLPRRPSVVWDDLVCCSTDLYPAEVHAYIAQAYADELIDLDMIAPQEVAECLGYKKEEVLARLVNNPQYTLVTDVVQAVRWWHERHSFEEGGDSEPNFYDSDEPWSLDPEWAFPASEFGEEPIPGTEPKVGRNDPCPCGSGKKYKKCCGRAASA